MKKKMTIEKLLKTQSVCTRASAIALKVAGFGLLVAGCMTLLVAGFGIYQRVKDPVKEFKATQEYKRAIYADIGKEYEKFEAGQATWEVTNNNIDYIASDDYAKEKLMESSRTDLIKKRNTYNERIDGAAYAAFGAFGVAGVAFGVGAACTAIASAADKAYLKRDEEEEDEETLEQE